MVLALSAKTTSMFQMMDSNAYKDNAHTEADLQSMVTVLLVLHIPSCLMTVINAWQLHAITIKFWLKTVFANSAHHIPDQTASEEPVWDQHAKEHRFFKKLVTAKTVPLITDLPKTCPDVSKILAVLDNTIHQLVLAFHAKTTPELCQETRNAKPIHAMPDKSCWLMVLAKSAPTIRK